MTHPPRTDDVPRDWNGDTTSDDYARWRAVEVTRLEEQRFQVERDQAERRARRDAQRAEAHTRYTDVLVDAFTPAVSAVTARTLAGLAIQRLFVQPERGAQSCGCACHPRLPADDLHDFGFDCPCSRPDDPGSRRTVGAWRTIAEEPAVTAARQAEERELDAWIATQPDVRITSHGGWAPEQWTGDNGGRRFYFRERWGEWTLDLDLVRVPALRCVGVDDDGVGVYEDTTTESQGVEIANGVEGCPGYGTTPTERAQFIAGLLRRHIAREVRP